MQAKDLLWEVVSWVDRTEFLVCAPPLTPVSLIGHCAALPLSQEHVSCEGRLHHVWVPEDTAHVPHHHDGHDQSHPVHR